MLENKMQIFDSQPIRTAWDEENEEWYFSVVDVVGVLTEQEEYQKSRKYWNKLKERFVDEGNETVINCHQLKMKGNRVQLVTNCYQLNFDIAKKYCANGCSEMLLVL